MTNEDLRDLDVRVHREIMGRDCLKDSTWSNGEWRDIRAKEPSGSIWFGDPVPRYSSDIAAAWRVVEKMAATHWLKLSTPFYPGDNFWAAFDLHNHMDATNPIYSSWSCDSAPVAICLSALKARDKSNDK